MQPVHKKGIVLLFFLMTTVDSVSLCPYFFQKVEIVLMYMEVNETIKAQKVLVLKRNYMKLQKIVNLLCLKFL